MDTIIRELFTEEEWSFIINNMPNLCEQVQNLPQEYDIPSDLMEDYDE